MKQFLLLSLMVLSLAACSDKSGSYLTSDQINGGIDPRLKKEQEPAATPGVNPLPVEPVAAEPLVLAKVQRFHVEQDREDLFREEKDFYNSAGDLIEERVDQNGDSSIDFVFVNAYDENGQPVSKKRFDGNPRPEDPQWSKTWEYEEGRLKAIRTDLDGDENADNSELHQYERDGSHSSWSFVDGNDDGDHRDEQDYLDVRVFNPEGLLRMVASYNGPRIYSQSLRTYDNQGRVIEWCQDMEPLGEPELECDLTETWEYRDPPRANDGSVRKTTIWKLLADGVFQGDTATTEEIFDKNDLLLRKRIDSQTNNQRRRSIEDSSYNEQNLLTEQKRWVWGRDRNGRERFILRFKKTLTYNKDQKVLLEELDTNGDGKIDQRIRYDYQPLSKTLLQK